MKKMLVIIVLLVGFFIGLAQLNYMAAIQDVNKTDRTDSDIETAMASHGFNKAWNEPITMKDKIIALFN
jgi:hypothetical protein